MTVPRGYRWHVRQWGDPLWSDGAELDPETRGTGASQERAFGDNNDGMALFTHRGRNVLAVNNEYVNRKIIYPAGKPETADDVRKGKAGHGVSVVEIAQRGGDGPSSGISPFNRRSPPNTPMEIRTGAGTPCSGPRPTGGVRSLAHWTTAATGERPGHYCLRGELSATFIQRPRPEIGPPLDATASGSRMGIPWASADERFDIAKHPNEPNRAAMSSRSTRSPRLDAEEADRGSDASSMRTPTALADDGRAVVYMGDDERGEFLYKFVSDGRYVEGGDNADLLESGKLFAAKFADGGRGEWIGLTPEATGMASQAEICIHTRMAASAVGRRHGPPGRGRGDPKRRRLCCLTQQDRGENPTGGEPDPRRAANPRAGNSTAYRAWRPDSGDHLATGFAWDLLSWPQPPVTPAPTRARRTSADKCSTLRQARLRQHAPGSGPTQVYTDKEGFAGQGKQPDVVGDPATGEIRASGVGPGGR